MTTGDAGAAQIVPYGGLPSPPSSSPSHLYFDVRQPLSSAAAVKGPQAVQPASGKSGPSTHTVFHAASNTPGPTLNYDDDPLAEFYPLARAERDAEVG